MKQPTREDRQAEREKTNALLRAYGYHWKRIEALTDEQERAIPWEGEDGRYNDQEQPEWVLLSPLEMPVSLRSVLFWLGKRGTSTEDVLTFLTEHGFTAHGKDERNIWRIQTPDGTIVNLKQALQAIEQKRINQTVEQARASEQRRKEDIARSVQSLKETLDRYGVAQNTMSAWGYSPYPFAKRLPDGTIEVTTYEFEGEWRTHICQDEEKVVRYLYNGYWDAGIWSKE